MNQDEMKAQSTYSKSSWEINDLNLDTFLMVKKEGNDKTVQLSYVDPPTLGQYHTHAFVKITKN